jgi:hypothetical protein
MIPRSEDGVAPQDSPVHSVFPMAGQNRIADLCMT